MRFDDTVRLYNLSKPLARTMALRKLRFLRQVLRRNPGMENSGFVRNHRHTVIRGYLIARGR